MQPHFVFPDSKCGRPRRIGYEKERFMKAIGKTQWLIPDMYWPEITSDGHYVSHESICVLNTSGLDCEIRIDLYFEDRPPVLGVASSCAAQRTHHIRMDKLKNIDGSETVPKGVPYAAVVCASVPIVVQYTRVDTTQCENTLMTSMAYPAD